jgi:hypothetical protein
MADEIKFEEIDPAGDLEVLMEGIDEIPPADLTPPDPVFKDLTKEQIIEKVRLERDALQQTKAAADNSAALNQVLKELKDRPSMPQQAAAPPPMTEAEFKAKFNEKFYDNPYDTMLEFQQKKLGPEVQRIMFQNMQLARKLAALDPDKKDTFALYGAEIDDYVARLPAEAKLYDPDIFAKAHDAVISRHVNEIVERKVREAVKGTTTPPPSQQAAFSERGSAPRPSPGSRTTIVLTRTEQEWAKSHMMSKEAAGGYFLRHPEKRMK